MSDSPLGRKGHRLRNISDALCVVTVVSWRILVQPFLRNKVRSRKSRYQPNVGVHMMNGICYM